MSGAPPPLDSPDFRAWRDATLYRRLLRASRAETTTTLERLKAQGYRDITLTHTNLLANLDLGGATLSGLARRVGVSRQAISQLVAEVERLGYVTRRPDPDDGRAVIVTQTAKGRRLLAAAIAVVVDLENEYERVLGRARLTRLRADLGELLAAVDPRGELGRD